MIKGGYILQPRKIKDSPISKMPPCTREVWNWILRTAFFADKGKLRRGQMFANIDEIRDDLKWYVGFIKNTYSRKQIEGAYEGLRKEQMIATKKVAHGLIITVCKYDYYQTVKNYEGYNEEGEKKLRRTQRSAKEGVAINNEGIMNCNELNTSLVKLYENSEKNGEQQFGINAQLQGETVLINRFNKHLSERQASENNGNGK